MIKCQYCRKPHGNITRSYLVDQFLTHKRQRIPLAIKLAPPEVKLKILKDRFMWYQLSGYVLDEEGAKREKDPDYKDIEISLWERTAACKRTMIFLPHLIDKAFKLDQA